MRIISGIHKGRKLSVPKADVRPTSAFTREAVFNILSHGAFAADSALEEKAVADLACGSGALGLEALSRGASHATFVDSDPRSLACARANADHVGETERAAFVRANITHLPPSRRALSLLFLDPPYFGGLIAPTLKSLAAGGWVEPGSIVVAECDAREKFSAPDLYELMDERKYGRAMIRLLRFRD